MSNIVPIDAVVPAHLTSRVGSPSALSSALSGGLSSGANFPRISIKASRFRVVEGGTETVLPDTTLAVVIVGANPHLSKTWYESAWTPDAEATAPDCFTLGGVRPDAESAKPQSDLCATCPQNAWGSRITQQGTKIKACSDQKRMAVVSADDPTGPVYLLSVTPAALKGLNQYNKELQMRGIATEIVKTIISFDTDASFPKLKFGFGGYCDAELQGEVDKLFGTDQIKEITGEETVGAVPAQVFSQPVPETVQDAATPVAAFGKTKTDQAPAAAPLVEPVAEELAAAPVGFGKKKTQPKAVAEPTPALVVEPVAEEPAAAPSAPVDATTAGLAADIRSLMATVSDDAS